MIVPMTDPTACPPIAGGGIGEHDAASEPRRLDRRRHARDPRPEDADVRLALEGGARAAPFRDGADLRRHEGMFGRFEKELETRYQRSASDR